MWNNIIVVRLTGFIGLTLARPMHVRIEFSNTLWFQQRRVMIWVYDRFLIHAVVIWLSFGFSYGPHPRVNYHRSFPNYHLMKSSAIFPNRLVPDACPCLIWRCVWWPVNEAHWPGTGQSHHQDRGAVASRRWHWSGNRSVWSLDTPGRRR